MLTGFAPLKLIDSKMDAVMKSDCNLVFECHPIRLSFGLNSILTNWLNMLFDNYLNGFF